MISIESIKFFYMHIQASGGLLQKRPKVSIFLSRLNPFISINCILCSSTKCHLIKTTRMALSITNKREKVELGNPTAFSEYLHA